MGDEPGPFERVDAWLRDFRRLRRRVGVPGAVAIVLAIGGAYIWWQWDEIAKRPGVAEIVAWLNREPIIPARPDHLVVAVTHLEGDTNGEHEKLLLDRLANEFVGAEVKPLDRLITLPAADTASAAIAKATDEANGFRTRAGADVILWGEVVRLGGCGRHDCLAAALLGRP